MDSRRRISLPRATGLIVLLVSWLNPFVEGLNSDYAYVFMFSHYAIFASGVAVGLWYLKWPSSVWMVGVVLVSIWHLPIPFSLSAELFDYRVLEESTILLGGIFVGANLHSMGQRLKMGLFIMWILADSVLSGIFIVDPTAFSTVSGSTFSSIQFIVTGIAMAFFMNFVIAYLLYGYFSRFRALRGEFAKSYQ
jgi:hypothetical protein